MNITPPAGIQNNNNKRASYCQPWFWAILFIFSIAFSNNSYAHRGAIDEIDQCRIKVGTERIHLSIYTPKFSQGQSFCQFVPNVGETELVFDYEGQKLRDVSIEFEITKEPDGTRIYYHEPEKIKKGTLDASVDFTQFGEGDYLVHITIVNEGEKLDSHLPFKIGVKEEKTPWALYIFAVVGLALVILFTILARANKGGTQEEQDRESEE